VDAVQQDAARDQAGRDQAARDQAARDQAARDQAARDQAVRDQTQGTTTTSWIVPLAIGIPGALVAAGGIAVGVTSMVTWRQADEPQTTQKEAARLGGDANTLLVVSSILMAMGVVAVGVATTMVVVE
jgi:hypothetical protein